MSTRAVFVGLAALFAVALSGCGEREQVVVYKQGKYQGKTDAKPWDGPAYGGDKTKWEAAVRARNQNQSEYKRITG